MSELSTMIHNRCVILQAMAEKKEQIIGKLSLRLREEGFVKEGFYEAVMQRENTYPTGLQLQSFGVAIPHTDAIHVAKDCIAIATMKTPVDFLHIGANDQKVSAEVIFLLAIAQPDKHLQMLRQLTELFVNKERMFKIRDATCFFEMKRLLCE